MRRVRMRAYSLPTASIMSLYGSTCGFNVVLELGKQREEVFFHLARFIKRHRHAVLGDHPLNGFRRRLGQILIVLLPDLLPEDLLPVLLPCLLPAGFSLVG